MSWACPLYMSASLGSVVSLLTFPNVLCRGSYANFSKCYVSQRLLLGKCANFLSVDFPRNADLLLPSSRLKAPDFLESDFSAVRPTGSGFFLALALARSCGVDTWLRNAHPAPNVPAMHPAGPRMKRDAHTSPAK
ncbi:hypothetical protein QBC46DRAFT_401848 [Diplogelasinospora grovesii]|uniref:Secreted protein n=1 Tax=Diplogelasinospora grovesii TaxID=303347 RepID=A0AAN6MX46_9PEZI|nr:hypothetical protein QBC46DRAFT_401848 [Diplogelasinospora grovesii]